MADLQFYPEMRPTRVAWLGSIPASWQMRRLKYLFTIKKDIAGELGHTVLSVTQKGIRPKVMTDKGQFSQDYSKYQLVHEGDFVMNHMDLLTGWVDIAGQDGVTSPDYRVFTDKDPEQFLPEYYKYIFQLCYSARIFYGFGQGVAGFGRWRMPSDAFLNFLLPIPSIREQRFIAEYLNEQCAQIDSYITEAQASIEDYKQWRQAIISDAVTKGIDSNTDTRDSHIDGLGMIPCDYRIASIRWLLSVLTDYTANGSFGDLAKNVKYKDTVDYARLVRLTDLRVGFSNEGVYVDEHAYSYLSKSSLYGGEILLANVGAYAGLAVEMPVVDFKATLGPNMFLIKTDPKKWNQHFAFYSMTGKFCSDQLKQKANNTTAQPKLNKDNLKSVQVVLPPIEAQMRISSFLDDRCKSIDILISEKSSQIHDLESYRHSLIYEVVTGKRKVVRL